MRRQMWLNKILMKDNLPLALLIKKIAATVNEKSSFDVLTYDTWLIDSGASSHMTNTTDGMIHLRKIEKR